MSCVLTCVNTFFLAEFSSVSGAEAVARGVCVVVDAQPVVDARVVHVALVGTTPFHSSLVLQDGIQGHVSRQELHIAQATYEVIGRTLQEGDGHACK